MGNVAMDIQALRATALLSILLWTKVAFTNFGLGGAKMNAGGRAPEDTYQKSAEEVTEEAKVAQDRAQRIVNNDLENIPYTMALAWGSMICIFFMDGSVPARTRDQHSMAQIILYSLFVVARIGHSVAYAKGLSYPRTAAFVLGFMSTFAIGINGVVASFGVMW
jgi:uncharacterized MAPEG superfamily protein